MTKASEKLNLSQSATSHALKRLRQMFNDPLLERSVGGMRPTSRAIALRESLVNILFDIEQLVTEPIFIPELAKGKIRIASSDYSTTVILPNVLKQLSQQCPSIDIECYDWQPDTLDKMKNGEIDLGLGVVDLSHTNGIRAQNLFSEHFVSIVRKDHPILQEKISIESYVAYPHALISTGSPTHSIQKSSKSHVDQALERLGVTRRIVLKLPHFFSAALVIQSNRFNLNVTLSNCSTLYQCHQHHFI